MDDLKKLKDVTYTYTYQINPDRKDVSIEKYIFEDEKSWASYSHRSALMSTEVKGDLIQGFDGANAWVTVDDKPQTDEKLIGMSDFVRKTNFYWLTMMQKLDDPGLSYEMMTKQQIGDIVYSVVKITFADDIGDAQDDYVVYINPVTKLIDQFTFTVRDFGMEDPLLMKVKYTEHHGIQLPTYRYYTALDDADTLDEDEWTKEISENLVFNSQLNEDIFRVPGQH